MEKLEQYRHYIQQILTAYSQYKPAYGEIEVETIFDQERDHYQIVYLGWKQKRWIHTCAIHIDIKNEQIWIQWNGTEKDIAAELVEMGVSKEDIVIGFHPPHIRKLSHC